MDSDAALSRLMEGNKRFVEGKMEPKDFIGKRKSSKSGQRPFATVVCCSDSRVVPEFIFDTGLEDIFTVITAGNVVDGVALGSVEYAVGHLHTPLVVVVGHENCGAVTAAYGMHREASITRVVEKILPAVMCVKKGGDRNAEIDEAIKQNVRHVMEEIAQSPVVKKALDEGKVKLLGMKYYLEDGKVEALG